MTARLDVSSKVLEQILKNQHTLARQMEITGQVVAQLTLNQMNSQKEEPSNTASSDTTVDVPVEVVWDEDVHSILDQDGLLQQLAQGFSDDRHHNDILWDDELEQDQGSHGGLLQLLADGGKYPGEECSGQVVEEVLTHVNDPSLLLENDMNPMQDVLDIWSREDIVAAEQKHVPIQASVVWDSAVQERLDELPCVDVVWDDMLHAEHEDLLQQLAQETEEDMQCKQITFEAPIVFEEMQEMQHSRDDFTDKEKTPNAEVSYKLAQIGEYLSSEEDKQRVKPVIKDVLTQGSCNLFLLGACYQIPKCEFSPCIQIPRSSPENIPAWMYSGFSPGRCEHRYGLYSVLPNCRFTWSLVGAHMICVDYKRAAIFVRELWDPGIWRSITRVLVLECSLWMIIMLSRRDGGAVNIIHWMTQAVSYLNNCLAWGQASFSGGGNVMTHIWTKRSPSLESPVVKSQPSPAQESVMTITGTMPTRKRVIRKSETEEEEQEGRLPPPDSRSYPPISSAIAHAPGLISPVQLRVLQLGGPYDHLQCKENTNTRGCVCIFVLAWYATLASGAGVARLRPAMDPFAQFGNSDERFENLRTMTPRD